MAENEAGWYPNGAEIKIKGVEPIMRGLG